MARFFAVSSFSVRFSLALISRDYVSRRRLTVSAASFSREGIRGRKLLISQLATVWSTDKGRGGHEGPRRLSKR